MIDVDNLQRRIKTATSIYEQCRSIHKEAMDYSNPSRQTFDFHAQGQKKERHVFDSTAVLGLQQFSNRIQSSMMPPWVHWQDFVAGDDYNEKEAEKLNKDLKSVTDVFFSTLNHSNFYTEISPGLSDLGIGTGAIQVEEEEFGKANPVRFCNIPLPELYLEKPPYGGIDNVWRKQSIRPENIKRNWPKAKLTKKLGELASKPDSKEIEIWNGQVYDTKTGKYNHVVFYEKEKHIIFEQQFNTKRLIVFRWHVVPGEVYGRGPIIQCMADIRTANKMNEVILRNAAIQTSGIYTGVSDGIFNPHVVSLAPGAIVPVASNSSANPSLSPMTPSGNIGLGVDLLSLRQDSINKALFADPLGDITDPVRTATEMMIRQQEMLRNAGASFGRLKSELIEPLTAAVMDVLASRGLVPDIKINGREVTIKQQSPMAKSEQLEDFQNTQVWMSNLMQFLPPEAIAGSVKIEELPGVTLQQLGVDPSLIRTEEERQELADQLAQAQQQGLEQGL